MRMSVCRVYVSLSLDCAGSRGGAIHRLCAVSSQCGDRRGRVGEDYHIEAAYSFWNAEPSLIVNSESLEIIGTDVDLITDLGIEKKRLAMFDIVLRPAKKHRFRFQRTADQVRGRRVPGARASSSSTASATASGLPVTTVGGFHDLSLRLRVRLPVFHEGLLRRAARPEVHQRRRVARQPDWRGIRQRGGADPDARFRGTRLRDAEPGDQRRAVVLPHARAASRNSSTATAATPTSTSTPPTTSPRTSARRSATAGRRCSMTSSSTPATCSSRGCTSAASFGTERWLKRQVRSRKAAALAAGLSSPDTSASCQSAC